MRKMLLATGAAIALSALAAGAALAQSADRAARSLAADTDGDGRISQAEFVAGRTARLTAADANRDGTVSREEAGAMREARRSERRGRMFTRLDTDASGSLSPAEFAASRAEPERAGPGRATRGGPSMGRQHRRGGGFARGPVQIEQARTRATEMFAVLDADRDGSLSEIERQAAPTRMRQTMREQRRGHRAPGQPSPPAPASE